MANENKEKTVFEQLAAVDFTDRIKKKLGLSYLSWAWAWDQLKRFDPDSSYHIYTRNIEIVETITKVVEGQTTTTQITKTNELPYFDDGRTCYVKVGVTIRGHEETELLPVMDMRNQAIKVNNVTMTDVNRALQRCFVKACARHGLGLYIYAGEDLPYQEPIEIDYDTLRKNADQINKIPAEELDKFDEYKTFVVKLASELLNAHPEASNEIAGYIKSQITCKVSDVEKIHFLALYRIKYFLTSLKKAFNSEQ